MQKFMIFSEKAINEVNKHSKKSNKPFMVAFNKKMVSIGINGDFNRSEQYHSELTVLLKELYKYEEKIETGAEKELFFMLEQDLFNLLFDSIGLQPEFYVNNDLLYQSILLYLDGYVSLEDVVENLLFAQDAWERQTNSLIGRIA